MVISGNCIKTAIRQRSNYIESRQINFLILLVLLQIPYIHTFRKGKKTLFLYKFHRPFKWLLFHNSPISNVKENCLLVYVRMYCVVCGRRIKHAVCTAHSSKILLPTATSFPDRYVWYNGRKTNRMKSERYKAIMKKEPTPELFNPYTSIDYPYIQ